MDIAFVIGTALFWEVLAIAFLLFLACEAISSGLASLIVFVALLSTLNWFCELPVFHWINQHWLLTVGIVGLYLAIGVVWSFVRWGFFVSAAAKKYQAQKEQYLKERQDCLDKNLTPTWKTWKVYCECRTVERMPKFEDHKGKIAHWIGCWFSSLIWFLCSDFLTEVARCIARFFKNSYERLAQSIYDRASKKFPEEV